MRVYRLTPYIESHPISIKVLVCRLLQRFVYPLTRVGDPTVLEERSHRTTALDLLNKVLKLSIIIAPFNVTLNSHFQNNAFPVWIAFLSPNKHCCRHLPLYCNTPLAECDAVVLCDDEAGNLIARAQASQRISNRRRMRLFPAQHSVGVSRKLEWFVFNRYCLDRTSSLAGDLDGEVLKPSWGVGESPETKTQL